MNTLHPFPEGTDPQHVEVLHCEPLGGQRLAVLVATRQVTFSLSGWDFSAAHLLFVGYQAHQVVPPAAPPQTPQEDGDSALSRYIITTREGIWQISATGCERQPLEETLLHALADVYAERMGVTRGTLFELPQGSETPIGTERWQPLPWRSSHA